MSTPTPLGPLSDPTDPRAALYAGHLIAQAERALPGAGQPAHLAFCWIASHVVGQASDVWKMDLQSAAFEGRDLGDIRIVARARRRPPECITLERRATLIRDGEEVLGVARSFLEGRDTEEEALESLLVFSLITLAGEVSGRRMTLRISDLQGVEIRACVTRGSRVKYFCGVFSTQIHRLVSFFT